MTLRTWAVAACLKTATRSLQLHRISLPNGLASDLVMHPEVIEKAMYSSSEKATKIVVEMGFIAYLESPSRDFEHYECGTLTAFMQRYFARKIDNACTMELSRLSMIRIVSGGTILSGEELVTQRKLIESLLSERLENYLRSTTFKFYQWVARI